MAEDYRKNLIIPKELYIACRDSKVINKFVEDYYHFFRCFERVDEQSIIIMSTIDIQEAKELLAGNKVLILETTYEYQEPTIDEILDKISKRGMNSLEYNERIILYHYRSTLL